MPSNNWVQSSEANHVPFDPCRFGIHFGDLD